MTDHRNAMGGDKGCGINGIMNDASLFEATKEEKEVSLQEREEDEYQRRSPGRQLEPLHQCECNSQLPPLEETIEFKNPNHDEHQETELRELRKRLESLRKRRRRIQQLARIDCVNQQELLLERLNERRRDRNRIVDEYVSAWKGRDSAAFFLDCARRWNVLNDCFYIWIDGKNSFATINGCRLGAEAVPLPTELLISERERHGSNINNVSPRSKSKWVSATTKNATATTANGNGESGNSPPRSRLLRLFGSNDYTKNNSVTVTSLSRKVSLAPAMTKPTRVPWLEVNAALGHACLLLEILQESSSKNAGTGMKFTHELRPMGSTSKIGIRFGTPNSGTGVLAAATGFGSILSINSTNNITNGTAPVIYNLFFEEASAFSFFKKNTRDFNWALQAFLQCIAEAAAQQTDKTIAIPHVIRHEKTTSDYHISKKNGNRAIDNSANHLNGGEWTIGGLSICYHPSQTTAVGNTMNSQGGGGVTGAGSATGESAINSPALEWTKACRYLLTDLKWLVAYSAKHVDR